MSILNIRCHRCGKPGSIGYGGLDSEPLEHACEKCRTYNRAFRSRESKQNDNSSGQNWSSGK